jgi:hypothetical protein
VTRWPEVRLAATSREAVFRATKSRPMVLRGGVRLEEWPVEWPGRGDGVVGGASAGANLGGLAEPQPAQAMSPAPSLVNGARRAGPRPDLTRRGHPIPMSGKARAGTGEVRRREPPTGRARGPTTRRPTGRQGPPRGVDGVSDGDAGGVGAPRGPTRRPPGHLHRTDPRRPSAKAWGNRRLLRRLVHLGGFGPQCSAKFPQ